MNKREREREREMTETDGKDGRRCGCQIPMQPLCQTLFFAAQL